MFSSHTNVIPCVIIKIFNRKKRVDLLVVVYLMIFNNKFSGDVVTPGFFREFPTTEDIMYRPYGGGEMNMFNFAYNLITLKFKIISL